MLTAIVQDPDQLDYQDVTCLWAVTLVDGALPLERLLRDNRRMRQVCIENAHWPLVYLGGLLAALVRTLPADDPWRHLGARLDGYADFPAALRNVPAPPRHTGALMPDGRLFGGPDHPRSVSNDPEMDVEFAALAGGLAPEAAALFALSADGWNATVAALTHIRARAIFDAASAGDLPDEHTIAERAGDHVWRTAAEAIRWAVHRRGILHALRPARLNLTTPDIAAGGADESPRDLAWEWSGLTGDYFAGRADELVLDNAFTQMTREHALPQPVFWPND